MPDLHAQASNITTDAHSQETFQTSPQFSVLMPKMQLVSLLTSQEVRRVCRSRDKLSQ